MNVAKNSTGIIKLVAFVVAIILCFIGIFSVFKFVAEKKAINAETKVQNALEDIKVSERTRVDSLQTLADSVKSYSKIELQVTSLIADARKNIEDANFEEANLNISAVVNVIQENYPELKSSDLYKDYMNEVTICNRNIETHRNTYNKCIRDYENTLRDPFWRFFISKTGYEKVEFERLSASLGDNQDMPQINWD